MKQLCLIIIFSFICSSTSHSQTPSRPEYLWFESQIKLLNDDKRNQQLVLAVHRDINERKLLEDKLHESEKVYRLVSENSSDVISLHKLDGTFEYISPSCVDLHGYKPEELIGRNPVDFIHPQDVEEVMAGVPGLLNKMAKSNHLNRCNLDLLPNIAESFGSRMR